MTAYGQVYLVYTGKWRGILMDEGHAEVWVGRPAPNPHKAFNAMKRQAKSHGITDLRKWSGEWDGEEA